MLNVLRGNGQGKVLAPGQHPLVPNIGRCCVLQRQQKQATKRRTRLSSAGSCEGCAPAMPLTCSAAALRSSAVVPAAQQTGFSTGVNSYQA